MPKDYYAILEVDKNAEQQQIKKAYRQKARLLHPDLNPSQEAKADFQELLEAYSILSDPDLRYQFDTGTLVQNEFSPPPPRDEPYTGYARSWNKAYQYESSNQYHTNYEANKRTATWVCLTIFAFSLSFFVDLTFNQNLGTSTVLSVRNKAFITQNLNDVKEVVITTDQLSFEKRLESGEISVGDQIEVHQSLIYRFLSFRRIENDSFSYTSILPYLIYLTALIVFFCGLYGITPFSKAERKFNAAIVGSFFSLALIIFLTFG